MRLHSSNAGIAAAALAVSALTAVALAVVAFHPAARNARSLQPVPASPGLATAAPFLLQEIREKVNGHWDATWRTLYPAHQLVASRSEYDRCEAATPFEAPLNLIRVVGVRRSLVQVPGLARALPGVEVTVRVELQGFGPRDPIVFEHRFHLVPVSGHWAWLLSPERYELYRRDRCGGAPAL